MWGDLGPLGEPSCHELWEAQPLLWDPGISRKSIYQGRQCIVPWSARGRWTRLKYLAWHL